ncbi:hypothetical protein BKA67DRAFT_659967 [Truncatella angustata]|uniref:Uncharacterized protein n=1 Tax=Truncatella angustata TaxID=152316 RepID=A0A9P8ZWW4_9PEZI|nr:uncharacterized protein BKA67DRAFT_659967 [Truncatella angustata]KAH6653342.1 hypothetical protein BKA67DRAFT_659967 [Truncatella angustata]
MPNPLVYVIASIVIPTAELLIERAVRSPRFHHGVQRIHRAVEDYKHGRDPNEPVRPGEATRDQALPKRDGFFKYFTEELRNQLRGTPTEHLPPNKNPRNKR